MIAKFRYDSENSNVANFALFSTIPLVPASSLHPASSFFFLFILFFALLSSWSLIYDVEFDSSSSCLDRLNNVGMISSQKL